MKISIIIPVLNEVANVEKAISTAWESGADEVVVVDGGSVDGTYEKVSKLNCHIHSCDPGRGQQLAAGAELASGDVFLFLHADNWLDPTACKQIRQTTAAIESLWGGFRQRIDHPSMKYRLLEWGNGKRVQWQGLVYGDQAMFVSRVLYDRLEGIPRIRLMEDFEFSRRLCGVARPLLLEGPVTISPRRWEESGVLKQTAKNWLLAWRYRRGWSPEELARIYQQQTNRA